MLETRTNVSILSQENTEDTCPGVSARGGQTASNGGMKQVIKVRSRFRHASQIERVEI